MNISVNLYEQIHLFFLSKYLGVKWLNYMIGEIAYFRNDNPMILRDLTHTKGEKDIYMRGQVS